MQLLQRPDLTRTEIWQRQTGRLRTRQGGGVAHLAIERLAAYRVGVLDRLLAFGSVDDQTDFIDLAHVNDMRPAFSDLVDALARHPRRGQHRSRTPRSVKLEALFQQAPRDRGDVWFVGVLLVFF